MVQLCIRLLGAPELRRGETPVTLPTRKALALLAYLAIDAGLHTREQLAAQLWPDSAAEQARASLRQAVAALRNAVGGERLRTEGNRLGLDLDEVELDTRRLAQALAPLSKSRNGRSPAHEAELSAAVLHVRGELLAGLMLPDAPEFEDWLASQRSRYRALAEEGCELLSAWLLEGGNAVESIDVAEHWLALEPASEAAFRRLMQAQASAGRRQAALRTYERCREELRRALDVEPNAETQALSERIRAAEPSNGLASRAMLPTDVAQFSETPFAGRAGEHAALVAAFHHAARGDPQLALVEGEAGIGKSRLAAEFSAWALAQGAELLRGRAFEAGGRLPYQPLVDALRPRLERENAPEDLLADPWLVELTRLLPELRERYPDLPLPAAAEDEPARTRLFEAVVRLMQALARRAPLLLLVDDLQWADAATLDLLRYLAHRFAEASTPATILLAVRAEAVAEESVLAVWLRAAGSELPCMRLHLGPLAFDATRRLLLGLATAADAAAVEPLALALQEETGGQPLFLMETLKTLVERGELVLNHATGRLDLANAASAAGAIRGLLPPGVRELVRGRLVRLPQPAQRLLAPAAVLGRATTFERLCAVAEMEEDAALVGLDALLAAHLLLETDDGDRYLFSHDRIRDVVYSDAGEARRRILHRRALLVLEQSGAPAGALAQHAAAARLTWPAVRYGIAAGDEATRVFAVRDAAGYYEQARRALLTSPAGEAVHDLDWQERERLYLQLGRARELLSEHDAAREIYTELLTAAQEARLPVVECAALSRLAMIEVQQWVHVDQAVVLLQQALAAAERSGDALTRAEGEWNLAQLHFYVWEPEASLQHGQAALALARELGHEDLTARALNVLSYVLMNFTGEWQQAREYAREAEAIQGRLGNRALQADCLGIISLTNVHLGRPDEAIAAAEQMLAISGAIENSWGRLNAAFCGALALLEAGRYGDALRVSEEGVAIARAGAWSPLVVLNLVTLGRVRRALFDFEAALALHEEARREGESVPWNHFGELTLWELAIDNALLGRVAQARALLRESRDRRHRAPTWVLVRSSVEEITLLLGAGERGAAEAELAQFGQGAARSERHQIEYLRGLATLREWDGNANGAAAALREALALAERLGLPESRLAVATALWRLLSAHADRMADQTHAAAAAAAAELAASIDDAATRARFLTGCGIS